MGGGGFGGVGGAMREETKIYKFGLVLVCVCVLWFIARTWNNIYAAIIIYKLFFSHGHSHSVHFT